MNHTKYLNWFLKLLLIFSLLIISSKQAIAASTSTEIQIFGSLREEQNTVEPSLPNTGSDNNKLENKTTILKNDLPSTGEGIFSKIWLIGVLCLLLALIIHKKKAY